MRARGQTRFAVKRQSDSTHRRRLVRASSIDFAEGLTPLDSRANQQPRPTRYPRGAGCGGCGTIAIARAIAPPTRHRTSALRRQEAGQMGPVRRRSDRRRQSRNWRVGGPSSPSLIRPAFETARVFVRGLPSCPAYAAASRAAPTSMRVARSDSSGGAEVLTGKFRSGYVWRCCPRGKRRDRH